jgi:hypothetical protein
MAWAAWRDCDRLLGLATIESEVNGNGSKRRRIRYDSIHF